MNKVLMTGRLTRDPELRTLASGKTVTQFSVATNEYRGATARRRPSSTTSSPGTAWPRSAARTSARASRSRSRAGSRRAAGTTTAALRHWKTEVVATHVEMLSGRRKKDYEAETAADALAAQANALGELPPDAAPAGDPIPEASADGADEDDEDDAEAA